jgi:hypothetical protein
MFDEENFSWLQVQGWYSQWLLRPLLFSEYIDFNSTLTLFVFVLLNQSGLLFYGVIRPVCSVLGAKYQLYGVPSTLRGRTGRLVAVAVLVVLLLNPGAWFDGVDLPNDLGLDWITYGTSIWTLGSTWDVIADYRRLCGQYSTRFPNKPRRNPVVSGVASQTLPKQYQRSVLPIHTRD